MLLSVPYGRSEDHRWFGQFDASDVRALVGELEPTSTSITVYAYSANGWQLSSLEDASDSSYRDYSVQPEPGRGLRGSRTSRRLHRLPLLALTPLVNDAGQSVREYHGIR